MEKIIKKFEEEEKLANIYLHARYVARTTLTADAFLVVLIIPLIAAHCLSCARYAKKKW